MSVAIFAPCLCAFCAIVTGAGCFTWAGSYDQQIPGWMDGVVGSPTNQVLKPVHKSICECLAAKPERLAPATKTRLACIIASPSAFPLRQFVEHPPSVQPEWPVDFDNVTYNILRGPAWRFWLNELLQSVLCPGDGRADDNHIWIKSNVLPDGIAVNPQPRKYASGHMLFHYLQIFNRLTSCRLLIGPGMHGEMFYACSFQLADTCG